MDFHTDKKSVPFTRLTPRWAARIIPAATCPFLLAGKGPAAAADGPISSPTSPMAGMAEAASLGLVLLKVFGALLLTVGLLLLLALLLRKFGLAQPTSGQASLITILDTKMIAHKKFVTVIRVADQTLALGVTEQQITLLGRLDPAAVAPQEDGQGAQPSSAFASLLGKVMTGGGK